MTIHEIALIVSEASGISIFQMKGKSRKREIVIARQAVCFLASKYFMLREIGDYLGGRDHSTVIHSRNLVEDMLFMNDPLYKWIKKVEINQKPEKPKLTNDERLNILILFEFLIKTEQHDLALRFVQRKINDRKSAMEALWSLKADQMLHEQMNQL
jgi:hypothetical protein